MMAVYDLSFSPASYDVVAFLCHIEWIRSQSGHPDLIIRINPGPNHGFRHDKYWPSEIKTRVLMRDNVVIPMIKMLPSVADVVLLQERSKTMQYGSSKGLYGLALQVEAMSRGVRPLRSSREIDKRPKLVTVTLRESPHWYQRNSNRPEWLEASNAITKLGYEVLVIPDTFSNMDHFFGNHNVCWSASHNLDIRARIYRSAVCNLFVSNGPAWFALALDAPVLMLKPTVENLMSTCNAAYFAECGIPIGGQIPSSPAYQQLAWEEDTADNIVAAFDKYMTANA